MYKIIIICKGQVQGVGFRYATKGKADALGISGSVINLNDKSVKIIASGPIQTLIELIDWCHMGPKPAHVNELIITYHAISTIESDQFIILR